MSYVMVVGGAHVTVLWQPNKEEEKPHVIVYFDRCYTVTCTHMEHDRESIKAEISRTQVGPLQ